MEIPVEEFQIMKLDEQGSNFSAIVYIAVRIHVMFDYIDFFMIHVYT